LGGGSCRAGFVTGLRWEDGFSSRGDGSVWACRLRICKTGFTGERKPEGGVAVAGRVYVTCYGFATKAGIACGPMQDITRTTVGAQLFASRSLTSVTAATTPTTVGTTNRTSPAQLSARSDCHSTRSPEAAQHVPLILPPLDDDCLIYVPCPG
jgi:hypothetical protein